VVEPPVHGPVNVSVLMDSKTVHCTTKLKISNWMISRVIAGAESPVSSEYVDQRG